MSPQWERYEQLELINGQLVAVWNRAIESQSKECEICIVAADGGLWAASGAGRRIETTSETMIGRLGWWTTERPEQSSIVPEQPRSIEAINITIPATLGLALASLVMKAQREIELYADEAELHADEVQL